MLPTSKSLPENLKQVNTPPKLSFLPSPKNFDPTRSASAVLPQGHHFFQDCLRENNACLIEWMMQRKGCSSWFVNQTFKNYEETRSAIKKYKFWIGRLKQSLIDSGGGELRWIRAIEWQVRDVIHFHSIVQGRELDRLSRKSWEDRWESLDHRTFETLKDRRDPSGWNTGFCRIYDAHKGAAPYLAKYTSKRLGGEVEWGGYWQGLEVPASVSCGHSQGFVFG